jgi:hypothetical protein
MRSSVLHSPRVVATLEKKNDSQFRMVMQRGAL